VTVARRRGARAWIAAAVIGVLVLVGGTALAGALSNTVESYTGCVSPSGDLSKFAEGSSPLKPCTGNQMQVSFSERLPDGCVSGQVLKWSGSEWACADDETGDAGAEDAFVRWSGDVDLDVPRGQFTELLHLDLEPGRYLITGKLQLSNSEAPSSLRVGCELAVDDSDGMPPVGGPDSDHAALHLAAAGEPGETAPISLFVSQELSESASVILGCTAESGSGTGGFANFAYLRADEVGGVIEGPSPLPQ